MNKILLTLVCFFSVAVHAEVYKWVDDKGVVHYGDKDNKGSKTVEMKVDMTGAEVDSGVGEKDDSSRDEKRRRIADAMEEDRLEKKEASDKEKLERKRRKAHCNQLKDTRKRLKKASGMYKLDKNGKRVYLSDKQRSKNEKSLDKEIRKYCG